MGLYGTTKNAERVFVGLNPYEQVRAGVGIHFSNQFRNHPTNHPTNSTPNLTSILTLFGRVK